MIRKVKRSAGQVAGESLVSYSSPAFNIALIVFLLIVCYWAYIIFSGQLANAAPSGLGLIRHMGFLLVLSGLVATASFAILTIEEVALMAVPALVGLLLFLGTPALVLAHVGSKQNVVADALIAWAAVAGELMLVVVALRVIYHVLLTAGEGRQRKQASTREARTSGRRKTGIKAPPSEKVFARCWEMPFCHESVRELCPAFKAKKTCWRQGRGCNCDADLIDTLVLNRNTGPSRGARGVESEYIRAELEADTIRSRSERTIPCTKCPIFSEHQRRKFRVINPILLALTLAALFVFYGPLTKLYSKLAISLAKLASGSLLNPQAASNLDYWRHYLDTPALQAAFVVILGLFFLAWILRFGEWIVLDKKLV